jgi:nucleoside-diphosphate-sugar epimerase
VVLVTGANGFLGTAVISQMHTAGIPVCATGIESSSLKTNVDYLRADITQSQQVNSIVAGISTVIHIAGLAHIFSPDENASEKFRQINEVGTANVASSSAAYGVKHLILISSVSVYGPYTQGMYDETAACNPVGPYALSKYNAELRAIEIVRESGMALTILRLATLYGEGDPGNVGRLIFALARRRFLWIGDGSNRKSLLYKGDAARACVAVAERPASGINIYNISAPSCTMTDIVNIIADALGKHPLPVRVPALLALYLSRHLSRIPNHRIAGLHQTVKKWLAEDVYDTRRFQEDYDFQTKTSLEVGLKREVDWYQQNDKNGQVVT